MTVHIITLMSLKFDLKFKKRLKYFLKKNLKIIIFKIEQRKKKENQTCNQTYLLLITFPFCGPFDFFLFFFLGFAFAPRTYFILRK